MLNNSVKINMNAPATGIIQKSREESLIGYMHRKSGLMQALTNTTRILQIIIDNDGYYIVEYLSEEK